MKNDETKWVCEFAKAKDQSANWTTSSQTVPNE